MVTASSSATTNFTVDGPAFAAPVAQLGDGLSDMSESVSKRSRVSRTGAVPAREPPGGRRVAVIGPACAPPTRDGRGDGTTESLRAAGAGDDIRPGDGVAGAGTAQPKATAAKLMPAQRAQPVECIAGACRPSTRMRRSR